MIYIRRIIYSCGHLRTRLVKTRFFGGSKYHERACYRCRVKRREKK